MLKYLPYFTSKDYIQFYNFSISSLVKSVISAISSNGIPFTFSFFAISPFPSANLSAFALTLSLAN